MRNPCLSMSFTPISASPHGDGVSPDGDVASPDGDTGSLFYFFLFFLFFSNMNHGDSECLLPILFSLDQTEFN